MTLQDARKYSVLRYSLAIAETACFLVFLLVLVCTGAAARFVPLLEAVLPRGGLYLSGPLVMLAVQLVYTTVFFPLIFYRSFLVEHQFGLSRQTIGAWAKDQLRAGILSFLLATVCLEVFYLAAVHAPTAWWLWLSLFWFCSQFVLSFLAPQVIVPIFFTYKPFDRPRLKERIEALANAMRVKLCAISLINLSAKTAKANAGLVGWGSSRRVVLGDTLSQAYSDDEILVILAHEFAHAKLLHVPKLIVFQSVLLCSALWAVARYGPAGALLARPESVPSIMLSAGIASVCAVPLYNLLSRRFERQADALALSATRDSTAFISAMEKLAAQNLSDDDPGWLARIFFFDHPPVEARIASARKTDA